jgi:hypothetical protein
MARGSTGMPGEDSSPRWAARAHPTPANFTAEFRHARLQAGEPSYRALERRTEHHYSATTIWRAFTRDKLPHWDLVQTVLQALGTDRANLTAWHEMWVRARSYEAERRGGEPDARQAAAANPAHETPAEGTRRLAALTAPLAADPGPAAGQVCDDCGALIDDLIRHQAWHWRVERPLITGPPLRAVEGTGQ